MMNSSSESVNANSAPATIAGMISGSTTCRSRLSVLAPRSLAARSNAGSKPAGAPTSRTTNGVVDGLPDHRGLGRELKWNTLVIRISRLTPISSPGIMIGSVIPIRMPLREGGSSGRAERGRGADHRGDQRHLEPLP